MPTIKIVPFPGVPGPQGPAGTANTGDITFQGVKIIGAGSASGDGNGYGTIRIVPDVARQSSDQYLIIDPTAPNHIHIRAGGDQDDSQAELILGGEKTNLSVSDNSDSVNIKTHQSVGEGGENEYYWSFGNDGTLYGPAMGGLLVTGLYGAGQDYPLSIGSNDKVLLNGTNGEFLNDPDNPNNQIATVGDISSFATSNSWTPVLTANGLTQSSNPATGSYTRVGNIVFAHLNVPFSTITNFGTGQFFVSLPFNAARHTDVVAGTLHDTSTGNYYTIKGHLEEDFGLISLWYISGSGVDAALDYNSPVLLDTTDLFHMSFTYEAEAL